MDIGVVRSSPEGMDVGEDELILCSDLLWTHRNKLEPVDGEFPSTLEQAIVAKRMQSA